MNPEVLALLAVACLTPAAGPLRPDPALDAALRPGPVAASPTPAEVAAALAAAAPPRRGRR